MARAVVGKESSPGAKVPASSIGRTGLAALAVLLAISVHPSWAADDAAIKGSVVDPLGARIAGATIKLLRDGLALKETTSDAQGGFTFDALAGGRYQIEATAEGFQTRTTSPIFVADGAQLTVEVPLPIGPLETGLTVTAAATELLPSQIGSAVTVLDSSTLDVLGKPDVLEALRLVPGASLIQAGARGGVTSMFIRGGNSNFNKVLVDGIPANDIGGGLDLAQFSMAGVDRIEVLRDANSVVFGSDALAGVISVTSRRGRTRVPEAALSLDGGNLNTHRESASVGGVIGRVDYFGEFAQLETDNDLPNNKYRNKTFAGRLGAAIGRNSDLSGTVRWIDRRLESPNGISFYGRPDDAFQTNRLYFIGVTSHTQITDKWQGAVRFGLSDQRQHFENPTLSGENIFGVGFGDTVTITGANGYSATGRAALDFGTFTSKLRAARQGIYGQTTYEIRQDLSVSAGANYEREQGFPSANIDADPTTTRHNHAVWTEGRATLVHRVSITAGLGYVHNDVFKSAYSPRVSVAAFLRAPKALAFWGDTRLTVNAGRGIKATGVSQANSSLYTLLQRTTSGAALAESAGIGPVAPERSRNIDVGIEQGIWHERLRARIAYFDNEFFDLVEFVNRAILPQFGIAPEVATAAGSGAYVNSQSFKAKGAEVSVDAVFGDVRVAGSYTHLAADVTRSLASSSIAPQFNPLFPGIQIGGFAPLIGQQPFRRPANTGSLLVSYTRGPAQVALSGYFAGKADDSTFLQGADINFGNTLLLPNHNLNAGYQKVDISGSYQFLARIKGYATIENVLDQYYEPVFGFPGLPVNLRAGLTVRLGGR
jgi:iron complex outermembrane receptor protein/vitamin B12 transporter